MAQATEMDYQLDLLDRRHKKFTLWIPGTIPNLRPPRLVLGIFADSFTELVRREMTQAPGIAALWELDPKEISNPALVDDQVYHYWFEVQDTSPEADASIASLLLVTDPLTFTVDYRVQQTRQQPASVVKFRDGKLWPCAADGTEPVRSKTPDAASLDNLPGNNHLVIYELPTSWVKAVTVNGVIIDAGTFADVTALFEVTTPGSNFAHLTSVHDRAILSELGINALELLPAADAKPRGEWGYATANYFAPDADLGTATDLVTLADALQDHSVRFIADVVMAFGHDPYRYIDYKQFHIRPRDEPQNSDSWQSGNNHDFRDGWGGESWRYIQTSRDPYDPTTGSTAKVSPAREFHKGHLTRWMKDFGLGGLRLDSVNNTGSWDFIEEYKNRAWNLYHSRPGCATSNKFLVIGEELSMPGGMLTSHRLDALWNEPWQERIRAVLLGEGARGDDFEWTVRKMVDCRLDSVGFVDGAQAVNYITSHDVEGYRKERLCNFLWNNGVADAERRAKLGFACLLTCVGIPMIFAGEEFLDIHDRPIAQKQVDPVNYARLSDDWRSRVFRYVANLIEFRKGCPALGVNDTEFIHVDSSRNARIVAWKRGGNGGISPVVVVANFSDENTPGSEYYVQNWPERGKDGWREVTQARDVPRSWVGREPLMAWEAKVYTY
jgi:pullulanase